MSLCAVLGLSGAISWAGDSDGPDIALPPSVQAMLPAPGAPPPPAPDRPAGGAAVIQVNTVLEQPIPDAGGVWRGTRDLAPATSEPLQTQPPTPISLTDARTNFSTVVETFILLRSARGYFHFRDTKTGEELKLKLERIHKASVELLHGARYGGRVDFREMGTGREIYTNFSVDFGTDLWAVKYHWRIFDESDESDKASAERPRAPSKKKQSAPARKVKSAGQR